MDSWISSDGPRSLGLHKRQQQTAVRTQQSFKIQQMDKAKEAASEIQVEDPAVVMPEVEQKDQEQDQDQQEVTAGDSDPPVTEELSMYLKAELIGHSTGMSQMNTQLNALSQELAQRQQIMADLRNRMMARQGTIQGLQAVEAKMRDLGIIE